MDGTGKLLLLLSLRPPAVLLQQQRQGKRTNQSHAGLGWGKSRYY
jgi:hypothetical protein